MAIRVAARRRGWGILSRALKAAALPALSAALMVVLVLVQVVDSGGCSA